MSTNLLSPGDYYVRKVTCIVSSLAISDQRIVAFGSDKEQLVHVPFSDQRLQQVNFMMKNERILIIQSNEASFFQPRSSGGWEIRFKTDHAPEILRRIQATITKTNFICYKNQTMKKF